MSKPQSSVIPVVVIGAAVGDIVATLARLPISGEDLEAQEQSQQVGGCALNVIRALTRLEIPVINGIIVGNGPWGTAIWQTMSELGLEVLLRNQQQDNGWSLALVEPNGERTFISIPGCESNFTAALLAKIPLPEQAIIYANGYELIGDQGATLRQWLLDLPKQYQLLIDFGPRIKQIDPDFMQNLIARKPLLSLNRDETTFLCGAGDPAEQASAYARRHGLTLICRLDREGAWICPPQGEVLHRTSYQVKVVDTIGAGDAHSGGLLAGLASGMTLADAVDFGNRVAAIVVSRSGPDGAPYRHEVELEISLSN